MWQLNLSPYKFIENCCGKMQGFFESSYTTVGTKELGFDVILNSIGAADYNCSVAGSKELGEWTSLKFGK